MSTNRKKFKIFYPVNHPDSRKAGRQFKSDDDDDMLVMSAKGVFFIYNNRDYYPSIRKLSEEIGSYDVVWVD
jgi:predicted ribosome-associated RNA-binding protein Tma20